MSEDFAHCWSGECTTTRAKVDFDMISNRISFSHSTYIYRILYINMDMTEDKSSITFFSIQLYPVQNNRQSISQQSHNWTNLFLLHTD